MKLMRSIEWVWMLTWLELRNNVFDCCNTRAPIDNTWTWHEKTHG